MGHFLPLFQISAVGILLIALLVVKAQDFLIVKETGFAEPNSASKKSTFKVDTANLTVVVNTTDSKLYSPVEVFILSDYCHNCSYHSIGSISGLHGHHSLSFLVDSRWGTNLTLVTNLTKSNRSCSDHQWYHYGERGQYEVEFVVSDLTEKGNCSVKKLLKLQDPINSYIPILVAFLILCALALTYVMVDKIYSKRLTARTQSAESVEKFINSDLGSLDKPGTSLVDTSPVQPKPSRERLRSIDSFRGLCIVIMVFVNYKGGSYWFFHHSPWNGLTVADLVFPWFMFIMGFNIVLSIDSLVRKATPASEILYKIVRRTLILFFLGLCIINHSTNFVDMRVPGVLQRFGISYFIITLLQWAFHKPVPDVVTMVVLATSDEGVKPRWHHVRDIVIYWAQWIIMLCFEALWLCLTFLLPVPGCPTGYIGPGGWSDQAKHFNCTGGAAAYIDQKVFGVNHIYGSTTARKVYFPSSYDEKIPFDPEGLLGSIHSCLIVFFGLQAGKIFLYYKEPGERIMRWMCWSLLFGVMSAVLTKCSQNDGWIPVNKNLWSTTFVTTLSCFAYFLISLMYYIIDVKKYWSGVPFYFVGMNSIFIYVGHEVFDGYLPFSWGAGSTSTHAELLAMNMLGATYWVLIAYYCYKIKFFVKI